MNHGTPAPAPHAAIRFPSLPWKQEGHPLEKKKRDADHPVTLLEFAPGFLDPAWCRGGHAGYVLSGSLRMEYEDGADVLEEGDAFWIDGAVPHRASNPGSTPVRLVIVTWAAPALAGSGAGPW